jgi:hypothetical protein
MAFMYLSGRGTVILDDFVNSKKQCCLLVYFLGDMGEGGGRGSKGGADMLLGKGTGRRFSKERLGQKIYQN